MKKRLDVLLSERDEVKSRSMASELIKNGKVSVNGAVCKKNSFPVDENDKIEIIGELLKYVGRGGLKLERAIEYFSIELYGRTCIDIGASTGGFTDCMLQNGAKKVYAVDVGSNQLDEKLKNDSRVISMEKTDIRKITDEIPPADFISIDVSFISLKLILPKAFELLSYNGSLVTLIKPQFEAGKSALNKNGIVKDEKVRKRVCEDISAFACGLGFKCSEVITSPIHGGDGNEEYLLYLIKEEKR